MNDKHPITPPTDELVRQWRLQWLCANPDQPCGLSGVQLYIAAQASRWGADQELNACCEKLRKDGWHTASKDLHAGRRPKPPSETDQALNDLKQLLDAAKLSGVFNPPDNIRRCLERLKKLEEATND